MRLELKLILNRRSISFGFLFIIIIIINYCRLYMNENGYS